MAKLQEEQKKGAPGWMVSFGDMMTLILTFFILLVSMSKERQVGLVASGVGSFLVALQSFGLPGVMSDHDKLETFNNVRMRFDLPPEPDPERREEPIDASQLELLSAVAADAMQPHAELVQPAIAAFGPESYELDEDARSYIDLLASTLRPERGQLLVLEGHALDFGSDQAERNHWLAFLRAQSVTDYLIDSHGFQPGRVETRAWLDELGNGGPGTRGVDARLITKTEDRSE